MKKIHLLLFLLFFSSALFAQHKLSGTVTDEDGNLLLGASIGLKGTTYGTIVGANGAYSMSDIAKGKYIVEVSFVGFQTIKEIIVIDTNLKRNFILKQAVNYFDDVIVAASRIDSKTPLAHQNIDKQQLERQDLGKDLPLMLKSTQSIVTTSDAGAGVGYSGLRIRGSDISRINVTINGVPLNDPESHGVFWVNMPDFAGTVQDIQIQRGVGISSNGAAAFGASIDLRTISLTRKPYAEASTSYGTFNTFKNAVKVGTGLINNRFAFNLRLSQITSDGFIDRATSDLKSYYATGGYYGEKTTLKLTASSGKQRTYQAWYGIPKFKLEDDKEAIEKFISDNWYDEQDANNLKNSDPRTYNFYTYDGETDNYQQDRYQAIFAHNVTDALRLNATLFLTYGEGYYEQYKKSRTLADYGIIDLSEEPLEKSDLIQQKWLDNTFYGANYSLNYDIEGFMSIKFGQSYNKYDGDHFGKVKKIVAANQDMDLEWYRSNSVKKDFSTFAIANITITDQIRAFVDLQYRYIDYKIFGTDDDYPQLDHRLYYSFFNPKAGAYFQMTDNMSIYASYSRANREPNRANIIDINPGEETPTYEILNDYEVGYKFQSALISAEANIYYMQYKDQLVLTGEINNVGTPLMRNAPDSYRVGIELSATLKPTKWFIWSANATFSENRIKDFTAYIPTYDENWTPMEVTAKNIGETTISFSPSLIAYNEFTFLPVEGLSLSFQSKYVGRQYIDNTENEDRSLDPYLISDISTAYEFSFWKVEKLALRFTLQNVFDEEYEANAWFSESLVGGNSVIYDGYFPQAGRHFLIGATLRF